MLNLKFFPYSPRKGQREFISFIQENLERCKSFLLDAPNGFGKTPCLLAALLPKVEEGEKIILWTVKTGMEINRPVEELKKIVSKTGEEFFGISYRGKKDMCLLIEERKLRGLTHEDANFVCAKYRNKCRYFNFSPSEIVDLTEKPLTYAEIYEACKQRKVCPYFAQRHLACYCNLLSLNYNYVFSKRMRWAIKTLVPFSECILVVDEAHNVERACQSLNSDKITLEGVRRALEEVKSYKLALSREALEFLEYLEETFSSFLPRVAKGEEILFSLKTLLENFFEDAFEVESLMTELKSYGNFVRTKRFEEGKRPASSLHKLGVFFLESLESLGEDENGSGVTFFLKKLSEKNLELERWDMRVAPHLEALWDEFYSCIFCSGSLKPFDAFSEVAGLRDSLSSSFPPPYSEENIAFFITRGVTTKGEELQDEMAREYLEFLRIFFENVEANSAVFSASFRIQEKLLENGLLRLAESCGKKVFLEREGMSGIEAQSLLEEFKSCSRREKNCLLIASSTGRFSEGVDFPGKELGAIFLVGIPFERLTLRTKVYISYFRFLYGKRGRKYAYVVPALRRASQTFGRALRNPQDKAILIAGDERFCRDEYLSLLPSWLTSWPVALDKHEFSGALKNAVEKLKL